MKRYGREIAKRLFQCSLDSIDTVEQIVKEENIDCGFARSGHLLTANKPKHFDALKEEVEFMEKEFNHKTPPDLTCRTSVQRSARISITARCWTNVSGGLNPAQYVAGLACAAEKAGAALHARARVTRLERGENRYHSKRNEAH